MPQLRHRGDEPSRAAPSTVDIGRHAETLAAAYLTLRGYDVVERNVRVGRDELDLIALHPGMLVVVEVRFRATPDAWAPEDSLHPRKRRRLLRAGRVYWERWHGLDPAQPLDQPVPAEIPLRRLRIDLIALTTTDRGLQLLHFQHVLRPNPVGGAGR